MGLWSNDLLLNPAKTKVIVDKADNIKKFLQDSSHPAHLLFERVSSGRSIKT